MSRILVVDDEPHVTRLLRLQLERAGHSVDTAGDGIEALAKLSAAVFDVVITDYNMPRLDGQGLCEAIRDRFEGVPLTVYLVTSRIDRELREWAEGVPRIQYLEKPLSVRELLFRLDEEQKEREGEDEADPETEA